MNFYKKIIKSQEVRKKILKSLLWVPDRLMLSVEYKIKTGHKLNLKNPRRYTEKLQWYKLNYRTKLMTLCSDKYTVRQYVEEKGLGKYLNELYGVYDTADEIDFDILPNSFAMKCSVGSGMNYFVQDKSKENLIELKKLASRWLNCDNSYSLGREWCYKNCKPRIVIEKLLPKNNKNDLPDYKFFCFNGKVFCLYTMIDYTEHHENGKLGFFNEKYEKLPYCRLDFKPIDVELEKPICFEEMRLAAEILSKDFPHARVDFYDINGKVVFGEITFYNASGFTRFNPDEFDLIMGDKFVLPPLMREDVNSNV